jgi:hypothetical protein
MQAQLTTNTHSSMMLHMACLLNWFLKTGNLMCSTLF